MTTQVMLAPNPNRAGAIDRVVVIGRSANPQRVIVLNVDGIAKKPEILKRFNPGYFWATKMWNAVSIIVALAGIALSFLWYWWAFIAGFILAFVVYRSNRTSVADFAQEAMANDPNAESYFTSLGLVWEVDANALVPAD
ncbi:MAG: hypothetical protein P8Z80_15935 [Pseudolabrys sp.]